MVVDVFSVEDQGNQKVCRLVLIIFLHSRFFSCFLLFFVVVFYQCHPYLLHLSFQVCLMITESDCSLPCLIEKIATTLGFCNLKRISKNKLIHEFMKGKNTFISLPAGYGKSLCYIMLPERFDKLRGSK